MADGLDEAKASHEAELFDRANVVGLAIGYKTVGGRDTGERCIVVYVERKLPEVALRARDVVPRQIEGVRTDVVETGRFRALPLLEEPRVARTGRFRPAPGGVSVGHPRVSAGTLGVVVRRTKGGRAILSNNHVLADSNAARPGDPILQPAVADGGTSRDAIAHLVDFVPLRFARQEPGSLGRFVERAVRPFLGRLGLGLRRLPSGRSNLVDAAIAVPTSDHLVSDDILEIGRAKGTAEVDLTAPIRKSGRTSGLTSGRVTGLDGVVQVDYNGRVAIFRRQIVGDLPSKGGDSGSLVVEGQNRAVGLLFAGSPVTTLLNPIADVLRLLKIEI